MTTALMSIPRWGRLVCADCRQPREGGGGHDCIAHVRHWSVERVLEAFCHGEFYSALWHFESVPDREKPIIQAILLHVVVQEYAA